MSYSNREISAINDLINILEKTEELKQIRDIVPVREWINSEYYLGTEIRELWGYWKDTIVEFFEENKNILVATGSLGTGKSFVAIFIFIRLLYYLSCFNYPSLKFGLSKSSPIIMMYLSPTRDSAEMTGFGKLRRIIDQAPYFQEEYKRDKNKSTVLDFQDKVKIFSGSDKGHFIGSDLFAIIFDEANFVRSGGGEIGKLEKAISIYRESLNRRKSRFIYQGKQFGASIIASSVDTITSFTEQEIERNRNNPNALIKHVAKYTLKPKNFSSKKFFVFKGDKNNDAFVVNKENILKYTSLLEYFNIDDKKEYLDYENYLNVKIPDNLNTYFEKVPIDFYDSFIIDTTGSLKEVCGISIQTHEKFFSEVIKFKQCLDDNVLHPFFKDYIVLSTENEKENELINNLKESFNGIKDVNYYMRIDLSKSGDSTGLALGHYDKHKKLGIIDLMIRIDPPNYPEKIDYNKIIEFVMYLRNERNFKIKSLTMDQYQSEFFLQYFNRKRINTMLLSVDRTDEQYLFLKNKIISNELRFYYYEQFRFELYNLIRDNVRKKIDHPPNQGKQPKDGGYGKDVCDAVCGLVFTMFMNEAVSDSNVKDTLKEIMNRMQKSRIDTYKGMLDFEEKKLGMKFINRKN